MNKEYVNGGLYKYHFPDTSHIVVLHEYGKWWVYGVGTPLDAVPGKNDSYTIDEDCIGELIHTYPQEEYQ